ncbi:MAG: DUF547 domain-containing protein [bacterium]|nr:DUF547 domain-containing protein [bacterium]
MYLSQYFFYIFRTVSRWTLSSIILLSHTYLFAIEHDVFNELLNKYVSSGKVNYLGIQSESREVLNSYLGLLSNIKSTELSSFSKLEQLALYINAYNAFTITAVLDHWPVDSIRDIPNVWKEKKYKLADNHVSLDEIEHKFARSFGDPRVHFALNCASVGCPELRSEAYVALELDNQLEDQTRLFFKQSDKFYSCAECEDIKLSKIFEWFYRDFRNHRYSFTKKYGKFSGVMGFIHDYSQAPMKQRIKTTVIPLSFLNYDWSINSI